MQNLVYHQGAMGWLKKQSFKSITISGHDCGSIVGKGSPGCHGPISSITALIFLRLFFDYKHGRLVFGTICPTRSCSSTRAFSCSSFPQDRGHWSTHMGVSVFHTKCGTCCKAVDPRRNLYWGKVPTVPYNPFPTEWQGCVRHKVEQRLCPLVPCL